MSHFILGQAHEARISRSRLRMQVAEERDELFGEIDTDVGAEKNCTLGKSVVEMPGAFRLPCIGKKPSS